MRRIEEYGKSREWTQKKRRWIVWRCQDRKNQRLSVKKGLLNMKIVKQRYHCTPHSVRLLRYHWQAYFSFKQKCKIQTHNVFRQQYKLQLGNFYIRFLHSLKKKEIEVDQNFMVRWSETSVTTIRLMVCKATGKICGCG